MRKAIFNFPVGLLVLSSIACVAPSPALAQSEVAEFGWPKFYVRGEIGGAKLSTRRGTWIGPGRSDPQIFHRLTKPTVLFGGFAVGAEVWRGVRLEAGYFHLFRTRVNGRWIFTVPATAGPHANMQSRVRSNMFMANAYIHPLALAGVNWPVQPFIGGGIGVALNSMDVWTRTNPASRRPIRRFERGYKTELAWNIAAGVSLDMQRIIGFPLTVDLTYRYVDAGDVRGSRAPYDTGNIPRLPFTFPIRAHVFTVGARMAVGVPGGGRGFAFSPARNFALPQSYNGNHQFLAQCSSLGSRFYLIPGTNTCLSIQGVVRAEYAFMRPLRRTSDTLGYTVRSQVAMDARTPTPYGPVQAFLRLDFNSSSGVFSALPGTSPTVNVDRAFIRFGGLLAGRAPSMFDFYSNRLNFSSIGGSEAVTEQLSFAFDFGRRWRAGIGVESAYSRLAPNLTDYFFSRRPPIVNLNAGILLERAPNIVGAVRYDGAGIVSSAQVSAALTKINAITPTVLAPVSEWGFAVQAGVELKLPLFAMNDRLWLQAAYANGNMSYLGADRIPTSLGNLLLPQADGTVIQGKMDLTRGYALTAAFVHFWTPRVSQSIYGSVVALDYPTLAQVAGIFDTKVLQAGTSVVWSPVNGFQLGGELLYTRVDPRGSVVGLNGVAKNYVDQVSVRLRAAKFF